MMKVLGIAGSPRKRGNTDILVDTFLEGAASAGAQVQKYFLADLTINQCQGCFRNCMLQPGFACKRFRDDMDTLLPEMASADLILFASPLYCATYTAIMARFFERCLPLWEVEIVGELGTMDAFRFIHNGLKGKRAVVGMVQDFKDPQSAELAFQAFERNIARTYMMQILEKLHVTDVRDVGDIKNKTEELKKVFASGKKLASAG
jgi:multimeric flavodoxin WrbA